MLSKRSLDKDCFYNDVVGDALPFAQEIALVHNQAFFDLFAAASESITSQLGIAMQSSASFFNCAAREIPLTLLNRSVNLGIKVEVTEALIAQIAGWMHKHAHPQWAFTLSSAIRPKHIAGLLEKNGFYPRKGGMAHFWREAVPLATSPSSGIQIIAATTPEHRQVYKQLFNECLSTTPYMEEWFSALVGRDNWHCYIAYFEGVAAGLGSFMINNGVAWLGVGATQPSYRGKGIQQALLARRINDACLHGVHGLTVGCSYSEEDEQPYSASGRNILRAGFQLSYVSQDYMLTSDGSD